MRLPLELVRAGAKRISKTGETRNVSSGGVLFLTDTPIAVGELIEYLVTLPSSNDEGTVRVRCRGKVVRRDSAMPAAGGCTVAATVERYEFVRPD